MRLGQTRVRENLAFVPMEIPITGEDPRKITVGFVREGGNWKLISLGLILLDVPAMARQWEQADLDASEDNAVADLHSVALALDTYRRAYGKLPDTLAALGPAPPNGVSPEAASLLDTDLAAGNKGGYTIRYSITPAPTNVPEEGSGQSGNLLPSLMPKRIRQNGPAFASFWIRPEFCAAPTSKAALRPAPIHASGLLDPLPFASQRAKFLLAAQPPLAQQYIYPSDICAEKCTESQF